MNTNPSPISSPQKLDRDPHLFMGFLTLVVAVMYVLTLISYPDVRKTGTLILFTVLINIHLVLHWLLEKIAARPRLVVWYIVAQGALAFTITLLSGNTGMIFALFMGLIGEAVGLLGITRWGILAAVYYLLLSFVNFIQFLGLESAKWWALGTLPIVFSIVIYVRLYIRQMEARTQAQALLADLEAANRQLTEYAARVEDLTIASERQRMARELHDTLSQGLAGLILQLEAVDAHLAGSRPERARTIVRETMERARSTLADARRAIDDLRRSMMVGLGEAARQETEHFIAATGIPCEVSISLRASLPDPVTEAAIRAVTEGLTNIARHARAKNAKLRIVTCEEQNELEIEINDDGMGFDPNVLEAGHYGLLGMRERVRLTGGRLEIHSEAGKGTRLVIRFPLEKHADE
ncbi:MAG: sensor histidine kinase [Chloroflexi bacterium]|nr:sensor histidine kinase [Chloroflexota bacterium]